MAVSQNFETISVAASGDISTNQFRIVHIDGSGEVAASSAATDKVTGILLNKPAAQGRAAQVAISGRVKMEAGAVIDEGDAIRAVTGGRGSATTTSGDWYVGLAATSAAGSGSFFECIIKPARYAGTA